MSDPDVLKHAKIEWYGSTLDLTEEQIVAAFKRARNIMAWPPSINEFRMFALELSTSNAAFEVAIVNESSKYRKVLTSWDWRNRIRSELKTMFAGAYDTYLSKELNKVDAINKPMLTFNDLGALSNAM